VHVSTEPALNYAKCLKKQIKGRRTRRTVDVVREESIAVELPFLLWRVRGTKGVKAERSERKGVKGERSERSERRMKTLSEFSFTELYVSPIIAIK
jgi:hypothetical protein